MNENEIQYHLAAVQGSLPFIQSSLVNNIPVDCVDEVNSYFLMFRIILTTTTQLQQKLQITKTK